MVVEHVLYDTLCAYLLGLTVMAKWIQFGSDLRVFRAIFGLSA